MCELKLLELRVKQSEQLIDLLEEFSPYELEEFDTTEMISWLERIDADRKVLVSSLKARRWEDEPREDTACETMCQDIDHLETVVGNVGMTVAEYREVQAYLDSMHSHIQVMIDLS